jgi:TRAP-type C4-dicarboxylate transport system permease small subunit
MLIRSVRKFLSSLYRLEEYLLSLLLLLMVLIACFQIAMRIIFSSGLAWADPFLRYLVLWSGLFGAVVATRMGKHIAIDLISHLVPELFLHWLQVAIQFFSMTVCLFLTYASTIFVINEALYGGDQSILGLSSWQLNIIFPVAFGLISFHFLIAAICGIKESISRDPLRKKCPLPDQQTTK